MAFMPIRGKTMATVTYDVPIIDKKSGKTKLDKRSGDVAWLLIGGRKVKCVIQKHGNDIALVHYASGGKIANESKVSGVSLRHFVSSGGSKMSNRDACEWALRELIETVGSDKVLAVIDAATIINK
jgi:hypothetical protein